MGQIKELNENISKVINELNELNTKLSDEKSRISKKEENNRKKIESILNRKYMNEIIETTINSANGIVKSVGYIVSNDKKSEIAHKYFGKKLIITDRDDWSTEEIITTYREQDCIEKIFRATKDSEHFSIRPQYHYTDQKIRVHIFCCLLGLTLATILQKIVVDAGVHISKNQLLNNLAGIRRCWVKNKDSNKASYILEEMDDSQSKLWNIVLSI